MKRIFFAFSILFLSISGFSQREALIKAFKKFETDLQLKSAISSLYIINAKTGKIIFDKNSSIGLAPASTQKLITSAAAYELLGKNFRYKTEFGTVQVNDETRLFIKPSGDPTLGSWRWESTKEKNVLPRVVNAFKKNISSFSKVFVQDEGWNYESIPDGWTWEDIGNFYGAGPGVLNWRENQFDVILNSGKNIGDEVKIVGTDPSLYSYKLFSTATAAKDTNDNAYIYYLLGKDEGIIRGTIPVNKTRFVISGAISNPQHQFIETLLDSLKNLKKTTVDSAGIMDNEPGNPKIFYIETSPILDSIIYWLNKKSVNLYAEALVKTISYEQAQIGSTEKGLQIIKKFWQGKGIDTTQLNIQDGSGLSPSNRVTTKAEVLVLQYAKRQSWFKGYFNSLPEYNGMKMKSGTIKDVKGFAGYHTSKGGIEYVFSFLVNNYNGSSRALVQKMYQVLNELK
jgi:D-alanyl-D-alanine carboxypeptidase/D-alanyl-D-alanine-endopeptidase (penicillin-binding protein 4)